MLHESLGFEVEILAGLDGTVITDYDSEVSKTKVSIEAITGTLICPRITIYSDFSWYDADGLYITIYYASHAEQLHVWVPKPDASVLANENGWSFQIPGKIVQDPETQALVAWGYRFVDLEVNSPSKWRWQFADLCSIIETAICLYDCPEFSRPDQYLGMIVVGLKRRKLSGTISPSTVVGKGSPDLNIQQSVCQRHSIAAKKVGATEVIKHTLDLIKIEPYQMGTLILHPQPENAFVDLDTGVSRSNHWMKTSFLFRDRGQLWRFIEGAEEPDPRPGKIHLAESRSASADLQAAIDQSAKSPSSAIDAARETRSKRVRYPVEARTPSRESSSNPSNVGHQAKKPKRKPAEANTPTIPRQKPAKEVPVEKQKTSKRDSATKSQGATEKPTPKAAVPKLKHLPQNNATQGAIAKLASQTSTSTTAETDPMNAIHKEIGTLREKKRRRNQDYLERLKPLEEQIKPLREQVKRLKEQIKDLKQKHQDRQDRTTQQIQTKAAEYTQMVGL